MRFKRRLPILFGVLAVALAVAVVVLLRKHAPPEPARLLPGADGFFYVNLKWIRRANVAGEWPAVSHDPEYEQFIQETGFQFERDLDQAAFAVHYPASLPEPQKANPQEPRYSEVFVGKIDGERLRAYLRKASAFIDNYRSTNIYSIPLEGRTLRVALLSVDTVAASNHPDPQVIRGMIDRSRKLASPFGGPAVLRQYYKYVPITNRYVPFSNLGWSIFRVDPSGQGFMLGTLAPSLFFTKPAVVVASARYLEGVRLNVEAFTESEDEAKQLADKVGTFLGLFHSAELSVSGQGPDPDVKQFLESLKVQQNKNRAVLSAVLPPGFLRKAVTGPAGDLQPAAPDQPLQSEPARTTKTRKVQ
jgi:hypothetical protein